MVALPFQDAGAGVTVVEVIGRTPHGDPHQEIQPWDPLENESNHCPEVELPVEHPDGTQKERRPVPGKGEGTSQHLEPAKLPEVVGAVSLHKSGKLFLAGGGEEPRGKGTPLNRNFPAAARAETGIRGEFFPAVAAVGHGQGRVPSPGEEGRRRFACR